jgi:hypothetical protein
MKAIIPKATHNSYRKHRRQLIRQIILPVVLAAILFIALIVLINVATFRDNGDVGRWAAISTMWIVTPIFVIGLIFLGVLLGVIYLLGRLLAITPTYTGKAQDFIHKIAIRIRLAADAAVKPIMSLNGMIASIQTFLGRK